MAPLRRSQHALTGAYALDALDTATIEDEDDAGGIYDAQDLDAIP